MKRSILIISAVALALLISGCGVALHNSQLATSINIAEITATNLPEDGEYALAGSFFDPEWDNTNLAKESADGEVTWTFGEDGDAPLLEVANTADAKFKIVQAGTWNMPSEGEFKDPHDDLVLNAADGLFVEGGTYNITLDTSKPNAEAMTGELVE